MSTKMTDADWQIALEAFKACFPARGARARNDLLFLEALHHFSVHNITWCAPPALFGHWNTIWKRFSRLSNPGAKEGRRHKRLATRPPRSPGGFLTRRLMSERPVRSTCCRLWV